MRLPKLFKRQNKQAGVHVSYSAVGGPAEIHRSADSVRTQTVSPSTWPADAGLIARARIWIAIDCVLLLLPIAFIGQRAA